MSVKSHRERELTFDVDDGWVVPDLSPVTPVAGKVVVSSHELESTYFDTNGSTLRLLGVTLRHRRGEEDAGWQLKFPVGDARTEVRTKGGEDELPDPLRERVAGVTADDDIHPVATIRTTRRTHRVLDSVSELVLEVSDDSVTGTAQRPDAEPVIWREVEVEVGPAGQEADLERLTTLLEGAQKASLQRKISRVLGEPPNPELKRQLALVADYLRQQCAAILVGDIRIRDNATPEAVHATRVGIRRMRSTLRLFDHVLYGVPVTMDDDLRWLGGLLSPIRDCDILARRMDKEIDGLTGADLVGPVRDEVTNALTTQRQAAMHAWRQAQTDPRYRRIMATLVRWYASAPVRPDVKVRPKRTLRKAQRVLRRRLKKATDAHGLHQSRKAAKRLRYTGDLLAPRRPKAAKLARSAKKLQTTLGEHQDLIVASAFVRELESSGNVVDGFSYGVLTDRLDRRAGEIQAAVLG